MFYAFRWIPASILLLVCLLSFFLLVAMQIWQAYYLPEPQFVELPEFKGRILAYEEVQPGTFAIKEDFDKIGEWGQEGILAFGIHRGSQLKMKVWRPDPKTAGVFQYAEKSFYPPDHWGFWHSMGKVERVEKYLKVSAGFTEYNAMIMCLGLMSTVLFFLIALVLAPIPEPK